MQKILKQNEKARKELETIMKKINALKTSLQITIYSEILRQNFQCTHDLENYQNPEKLKKMKIRLNQKIADLELSIEDTEIVRSLK